MKSKNRQWLEEKYLPHIKGEVLFVGTNSATADYKNLYPHNYYFTTVDINPHNAQYQGHKHYVCDFLDFQSHRLFDHISLFGMTPRYVPRHLTWVNWTKDLLAHAHQLLTPTGTILLGSYLPSNWSHLLTFPLFNSYVTLTRIHIEENNKPLLIWWIRRLA